jgi:hypothetical protein
VFLHRSPSGTIPRGALLGFWSHAGIPLGLGFELLVGESFRHPEWSGGHVFRFLGGGLIREASCHEVFEHFVFVMIDIFSDVGIVPTTFIGEYNVERDLLW